MPRPSGCEAALRDQILGGFPGRIPLQVERSGKPRASGRLDRERTRHSFARRFRGGHRPGSRDGPADFARAAAEADGNCRGTRRARQNQTDVARSRLWNVGADLPRSSQASPIGGVPDHTRAEWGLWVGRPLLGQWVWDIIRWLDFLDQARWNGAKTGPGSRPTARPFVLVGVGHDELARSSRGRAR